MIGFELKAGGADFQGQDASRLDTSAWSEGTPVWPIEGLGLEEAAATIAEAKFEKAWKNLGRHHINLTLTHDAESLDQNEQFQTQTFDIHDEASMKEFIKYLLENGLSGGNLLDSIATVLDHVATSGVTEHPEKETSVEIQMTIDT